MALVRGDARALACLKARVMSLVTRPGRSAGAGGRDVEVVIRL